MQSSRLMMLELHKFAALSKELETLEETHSTYLSKQLLELNNQRTPDKGLAKDISTTSTKMLEQRLLLDKSLLLF
jgi:hypothetical protein